jgi:hypothetical protein
MASLVQQAMNAQIEANAPPLDDSRDWESDGPDGADAADGTADGPVNERPDNGNPDAANRRDLMLMSTDDLKKRTAKLEALNQKKFGANKKTIDMLRLMSADAFDFICRCAEWESGKSSIRNEKKAFQNALQEDSLPRSPAMEGAWRSRPYGCTSLKKAVLLRLKDTLEEHGVAQTHGDVVGTATRWAEAQELKKALKIVNERAENGTMEQRVVKDAFGFCKQQEAGEQVRAEQRRRGEDIPKEELYRRWPCLAPDWSISAERDAKRNGEAPIVYVPQRQAVPVATAADMPRKETADFIADQYGREAAAVWTDQSSNPSGVSVAAQFAQPDRRYDASPERVPVRTNASPERVQAYADGKRQAPAEGSCNTKKQKRLVDNSDEDSESEFL